MFFSPQMNLIIPITLHLSILIIACYFECKTAHFYTLFYTIYTSKFLHLLHSSLFGHIICSIGFLATNKFLGQLTGSEFSTYNDKALTIITELIMLGGSVSNELSLMSIGSVSLLYVFKSFAWTLDVKSQKQATKRMLFGSTLAILMSLLAHKYYSGLTSLLSLIFCMEYSLVVISILKNQLIVCLDLNKVENNRSFYIFIITMGYLALKSCVFAVFISRFSKRTRFPYGILKSLLATGMKLYKKLILFKKYLKLVKDLDAIEEFETEGSCAICTDEIVKGKRLACSHVFHSSCLKMWCEREVSCPICRAEIIFKKEEIQETSDEILSGVPIEVE